MAAVMERPGFLQLLEMDNPARRDARRQVRGRGGGGGGGGDGGCGRWVADVPRLQLRSVLNSLDSTMKRCACSPFNTRADGRTDNMAGARRLRLTVTDASGAVVRKQGAAGPPMLSHSHGYRTAAAPVLPAPCHNHAERAQVRARRGVVACIWLSGAPKNRLISVMHWLWTPEVRARPCRVPLVLTQWRCGAGSSSHAACAVPVASAERV
jgi:hypothetical protein